MDIQELNRQLMGADTDMITIIGFGIMALMVVTIYWGIKKLLKPDDQSPEPDKKLTYAIVFVGLSMIAMAVYFLFQLESMIK